MKEKDKISAKLQQAFNDGFVPKEIRQYMKNNGHEGQVWIVEQPDTIKSVKQGRKTVEVPVFRIGIGYKLLEETQTEDEDGNITVGERAVNHIISYDQDEIESILREIK
jgi:hypothetical protein